MEKRCKAICIQHMEKMNRATAPDSKNKVR